MFLWSSSVRIPELHFTFFGCVPSILGCRMLSQDSTSHFRWTADVATILNFGFTTHFPIQAFDLGDFGTQWYSET